MRPAWLAQYVGLSFADRGRGPHAYDCWGLYRQVLAAECGIVNLPSFAGAYASARDSDAVAALVGAEAARAWQRVDPADARCFDALVFNIHGRPRHIACALGPAEMLHIDRHIAACIELWRRHPWWNRLEGVYRYVG